jgi:hypothetical protein
MQYICASFNHKTQRMYKNNNFTAKVLFSSEIPFSNLSFDVEYAVDCIITLDRSEGTVDNVEITRCAVQNGTYDDGETVLMSAWAMLPINKISPNTLSVIEASVCQEFFDALEKGGGDGEYESEQFPEIPGAVISVYEPVA